MNKICNKCNDEKEENQFNFRDKKSNIRHHNCKDCQKIIRKQSYQNNRQHYLEYEKINTPKRRKGNRRFITEFKTNKPCKDCNKIYPPYVMDFDHLRDKEFGLSKTLSYQWGKERVIREIEKCELVCANCHRERTYSRHH